MEREGVPVYGIEAFVHEASCTDLGWPAIRLEDEQILWQKEALLNLAVRRVPKEYNAVAWIDPDVWLTNSHWRAQAEDRLRDYDAVQLFERACWTAEDGQIDMSRRCAAGVSGGSGHPGFGWALRREMWPLPDWYCTGSGDQDMVKEWKQNSRVSYVLGDCVHEFHGRRSDRQYYERHLWRQGIPAKDCVVRAANGLMEWSPSAPQSLRAAMKNYFLTRKEDG